ncbi:MAG: DUF3343 domain-containing protein [Gemmatimonadota bacterium]|nr:MAG: DUF3343 domain-containing protein [Gemmatimonadota bacterium]
MNCVITFDSIHRVMKAERILKSEDVSLTLVPTPREISSECGMVVQVGCEELERVQEIFNKNRLEIEGIYQIDEKKKTRKSMKV